MEEDIGKYINHIKDLENRISEMRFELEVNRSNLLKEQEQHHFYQLVADFTFGWELWFDPHGKIKYCSPSCYDLTGFTANQILTEGKISELLVYAQDRDQFDKFISESLDQMLINQALEFRILTRTRQLRWCQVKIRGVYDKNGRYLGVRASVHDITRLKNAMGHIHSISEKNEMESRSKQRLQSELHLKERELISFLLQLSRKNELIALIRRQLETLQPAEDKKIRQKVDQLIKNIDAVSDYQPDWDLVVAQLEKLYPGFMERLNLKHPKITAKERKLCASLRLGLSSKEIAGLNNITPQSVEIARVRLRRKLNLPQTVRLQKYLEQI